MEVSNVSARRADPDQVTTNSSSDLATRLLAWMARTQQWSALDTGEVAGQIADGLREFLAARSVVVLLRRLPGDNLVLLAATDISSDDLLPHNTELPRFPARHLLSVLPPAPFAVAAAEPHLQVFAGELWDFVSGVAEATLTTSSVDGQSTPPGADLIVPLRSINVVDEEEVVGLALLWLNTGAGFNEEIQSQALRTIAGQAGDWLAVTQRLERVGTSYRQMAGVFANAIDGRDPQRFGHSSDVAYYAGVTAREMGLSDGEIERVEFASLLHDIGKIGVPDSILQKQEALTETETEVIRASTLAGAEWLAAIEGLDEVATIVRHQSERYDGTGYPDRLSGEAIPLGSRILAVAIRFSAMTKPRADRRALSVVGGALEFVAYQAGSALDPQVVKTFLAAMGRRSHQS